MWISRLASLARPPQTTLLVVAVMVLLAPATVAGTASGDAIDAAVWDVISATVAAGDIEGMAVTYHPDAVLVSNKGTVAIAEQLIKWGQGMEQAHLEGTTATVAFRFEARQDDAETAFERGIFRYAETPENGLEEPSFVPFETLLVKRAGTWLILMERQLAATDQSAWDKLGG